MIRLKTVFTACIILLGAAIGLRANPISVCPTTGTYADLQTLGSCTIGDETYSTFSFSTTDLQASAIDYTVTDDDPSSIGFSFSLSLSASAGGTSDISLGYTITGMDIEDADLTMAGTANGTGSSATIAETICPGSAIASCSSSTPLNAYTIYGGATDTSDSAFFEPVGTLGVLADAEVLGGTGSASISSFSITSSEIASASAPEPGTLLLLGTGLLGLAGIIKRKRSS